MAQRDLTDAEMTDAVRRYMQSTEGRRQRKGERILSKWHAGGRREFYKLVGMLEVAIITPEIAAKMLPGLLEATYPYRTVK